MFVSKSNLRHILGDITQKKLIDILSSIDDYYYSYTKTTIKEDGTKKNRLITPSTSSLKYLQIKLKYFLSKIELPEYVHGGVSGRSNVTHAKAHLGKKYSFSTDIEKFFPSISYRHVYRMFVDNGFSPDIASILTKLTTYMGCIPQGAPTSTVVANLVFLSTDKRLDAYCKLNGITYTRYVDDLQFSGQSSLLCHSQQIVQIVCLEGFRINRKKTKAKIGPVETTGIKINNNYLDVSNSIIKKIANTNQHSRKYNGLIGYRDYVRAS